MTMLRVGQLGLLAMVSLVGATCTGHKDAPQASDRVESAEPIKLTLVIRGMFAFAPSEEGDEMMVFAVNELHPTVHGGVAHRAYLGYECGSLKEEADKAACDNRVTGDYDGLLIDRIPLDPGFDLSIEAGGKSLARDSLKIASGPGDDSFDWVVPVASFAPEAQELRPELLSYPPSDGLRELVLARLQLTQGQIRTSYVDENGPWAFALPGGETFQQPVAGEVTYDVEISGGGPITIRLTQFDGKASQNLNLQPPFGTDRVNVYLFNEPTPEEFCATALATATTGLAHFAGYYRLAQSSGRADRPIPVPTKYQDKCEERRKCMEEAEELGKNKDECGRPPVVCLKPTFKAVKVPRPKS